MKKILKDIGFGLIAIIVAPAAVIHIAYRHWYFKNYILGSPSDAKVKNGDKK